jgi:hypothetical protein
LRTGHGIAAGVGGDIKAADADHTAVAHNAITHVLDGDSARRAASVNGVRVRRRYISGALDVDVRWTSDRQDMSDRAGGCGIGADPSASARVGRASRQSVQYEAIGIIGRNGIGAAKIRGLARLKSIEVCHRGISRGLVIDDDDIGHSDSTGVAYGARED